MRKLSSIAALLFLHATPGLAQHSSPVVNADRSVTFSLKTPKAGQVTLGFDAIGGRLTLEKGAGGAWHVTTPPVDPGIYYYRFYVDGLATVDPENPLIAPNYVLSNVIEIRDAKSFIYDLRPDVAHGTIHLETFTSKLLAKPVQFYVYTPPGYERSGKRYPVLYDLHGAPGFPMIWDQINSSQRVLDNLLAEGRAPALIFVIPTAEIEPFFPFPRLAQPSVEAGKQGLKVFERYFLEEILPLVETRYRIQRDQRTRWLTGYSLGGIEAFHVGVRHPELFSVVRVAATGFLDGALLASGLVNGYPELKQSDRLNQRVRLFYLDCGSADSFLPQMQSAHEELQRLGIKHEYVVSSGGGGTHVGVSTRLLFAAFVERLNAAR